MRRCRRVSSGGVVSWKLLVDDTSVAALLVRAARLIEPDTAVFVGFNWPMLAARLARSLGKKFDELYEAGVVISEPSAVLGSSTTDFDAFVDLPRWQGSTLELMALVPRAAFVMLDAANVDIEGHINSFGAGPAARPTFRSAGGGGSADVAARARRLVLIHAGKSLLRIERHVATVTASARPGTEVTLLTRWGSASLGDSPAILDVVGGAAGAVFLKHLVSLGASSRDVGLVVRLDEHEAWAAELTLREAGRRGYRAAAQAVDELMQTEQMGLRV